MIYFETKQRYGSPRITLELQSFGYKISRITVAKYMKQLGLRSKLSKKFKVSTNSNHNYLIVENILNREFIVKMPSKVWVSDITYIQTKEGFIYLTTIMDLYDRKIIGWSLSDGMSTDETTLPKNLMAEDLYSLSKADYIIGPPSSYSAWASLYGSVPLCFIEDSKADFSISDFIDIKDIWF